MTAVHYDSPLTDAERRSRLYAGDLFVYHPVKSTLEFCAFARQFIEEAFGERAPEYAQFDMPVEEYAELLGKMKPRFIHHPESKRHIRQILNELGCDLDRTYFEVPKLRSSTSHGYLTAGVAYAWHPHRDTWYSSPQCQLNWWMPIYPIQADNCMAFHLEYFQQPIENTSSGYNYYEWNVKHRGAHLTQYIDHDPRPLPAPVRPLANLKDVRIVCPPGSMILFSAAQLHSSVPNESGKTRFSVDFRTAHLDDLVPGAGAPNVDSACTGTVLREFRRASDLSELPEDVLERFEDGTEGRGVAVFGPPRDPPPR